MLQTLHYANKPVRKKGFHLLGRRSTLPEGWVEDYTRTVQALAHLNTNRPEHAEQANQLNAYLDELDSQAVSAGRGNVYRPKPDHMGIYPNTNILPLEHIKTAIRANSPSHTRHRAWEEVKAKVVGFVPAVGESIRRIGHTGLDSLQHRHFMEAIAVAVPIAKGREPHFLGNKVPGELDLGPTGTRTIVGGTQMSTSDWGRGFTPMKFGALNALKRNARRLSVNSRILWRKGKNNKLAVLGAGAVGSVVASPLYETPGYVAGFKRGQSGKGLSLSERTSRRFVPGYMDAYGEGKESKKGHKKEARYQMKKNEAYYYKLGFTQGIKDHMHTLMAKLRGDAVPTLIRGAFVGGLGKLHQEIGLPPTTVDGIPVNRRSFGKPFEPYTTSQLRAAKDQIANDLTGNEEKDKAVQKTIGKIDEEIRLRQSLSSV